MDNSKILLALMPREVGSAFELMKIADEEAARAYPSKSAEPKGMFMALLPPPAMRTRPRWFIRAHMRELCQRRTTRDLRGGTLAEACLVFERTALTAPLRKDPALAYARALRELVDMLAPHERPASASPLSEEDARQVWGWPTTDDAVSAALDEARRVGARERSHVWG